MVAVKCGIFLQRGQYLKLFCSSRLDLLFLDPSTEKVFDIRFRLGLMIIEDTIDLISQSGVSVLGL